jgi:hypothetical protein
MTKTNISYIKIITLLSPLLFLISCSNAEQIEQEALNARNSRDDIAKAFLMALQVNDEAVLSELVHPSRQGEIDDWLDQRVPVHCENYWDETSGIFVSGLVSGVSPINVSTQCSLGGNHIYTLHIFDIVVNISENGHWQIEDWGEIEEYNDSR